MSKSIKIEPLDDRHQLFVDGSPSGIFDTEAAAKKSARRFVDSTERITWSYGQDVAVAVIRPKKLMGL